MMTTGTKRMVLCIGVGVLLMAARHAYARETMDETPAQRDARMQWWSEARFGMFDISSDFDDRFFGRCWMARRARFD